MCDFGSSLDHANVHSGEWGMAGEWRMETGDWRRGKGWMDGRVFRKKDTGTRLKTNVGESHNKRKKEKNGHSRREREEREGREVEGERAPACAKNQPLSG